MLGMHNKEMRGEEFSPGGCFSDFPLWQAKYKEDRSKIHTSPHSSPKIFPSK